MAFWTLLAAGSWVRVEKAGQARRQLSEARRLYGELSTTNHNDKNENYAGRAHGTSLPAESMYPFWTELERKLGPLPPDRDLGLSIMDPNSFSSRNASTLQVETETLNEISIPPLSPRAMEARGGDLLGLGAREDQAGIDGFE